MYVDYLTNNHIPFRNDRKLTGTARYASIYNHPGFEQSSRDDLESLGYTIVYYLKGKLPWQGVQGNEKRTRNDQILHVKKSFELDVLCRGLPEEVTVYLMYCRSLKFEDKPDYHSLIKQFSDYLNDHNLMIDFCFDWEKSAREKMTHRTSSFCILSEHEDNKKVNAPQNKNNNKVATNSAIFCNPNEAKCYPSNIKSKLGLPSINSLASISIAYGSNLAEFDCHEAPNFKNSNSSCNLKGSDIDESCKLF